MTLDPEDNLLRALPAHDVRPRQREHIRRRAHALLTQRRMSHPLAFRVSSAYHRCIEPAALVILGFAYMAMTVRNTLAIYQ